MTQYAQIYNRLCTGRTINQESSELSELLLSPTLSYSLLLSLTLCHSLLLSDSFVVARRTCIPTVRRAKQLREALEQANTFVEESENLW